MNRLRLYTQLAKLSLREFSEIVVSYRLIGGQISEPRILRLAFIDDSLLDIRYRANGPYSLHRQQPQAQGVYRWDNVTHHPQVATHPHHFHDGREENVVASDLPHADPEAALRFVLIFVATQIPPRDEVDASKSQP